MQKNVSQMWGQTVQLLSIYIIFLVAMIPLFFLITQEHPGAPSLDIPYTRVMYLPRQVRCECSGENDPLSRPANLGRGNGVSAAAPSRPALMR